MTKQDFQKVMERWYAYIGKDHHKDRDCRFLIEERWEYGECAGYTVDHWGYLLDDIKSVEVKTIKEAYDIVAGKCEEYMKDVSDVCL